MTVQAGYCYDGEVFMSQRLELARAKVEKLEKENRMLRAQIHTLEHEVRRLRADLYGERIISTMIREQLEEQEDEEYDRAAQDEAFYAQRERDYRE